MDQLDQRLEPLHLSAETLMDACDFLTPEYAGHMSNACAYSSALIGHASGVTLAIQFASRSPETRLTWDLEINDAVRSSHANTTNRIELAAEAMAIAMLPRLTNKRVAIKSDTGTGFDFQVESETADDYLIFNDVSNESNPVAIEISGIERATRSNSISARIADKVRQQDQAFGLGSGNGLVWLAVFEISTPIFVLELT